jgi:8-oxo-dGTP pyrophosphatase MutT (NUDIX family)/phosphohistidine phosphatase SixA
MSKTPDGTIRAAGGVVWRPGSDGVREIAIVHRPRYDDWSLPKGKLDKGEHALAAACREVVEETGLQPIVGPRLPSTHYLVDMGEGPTPKTVDYWSMSLATSALDEFVPNDEVDGLAWLPTTEAAAKMTHDHDAVVIQAFARLPAVTGTVLLVRHAKAGDRQHWVGRDDERPLDRSGQVQAEWLAALLPRFAPTQVFSATRTRCLQTLEPLATALGLSVVTDEVFDEDGFYEEPDVVVDRTKELAAAGGVSAVCSQGGIIPATVALLLAENVETVDGVETAGRMPAKIPCRKGSVWTLYFGDGRLIAADYLATPRP